MGIRQAELHIAAASAYVSYPHDRMGTYLATHGQWPMSARGVHPPSPLYPAVYRYPWPVSGFSFTGSPTGQWSSGSDLDIRARAQIL